MKTMLLVVAALVVLVALLGAAMFDMNTRLVEQDAMNDLLQERLIKLERDVESFVTVVNSKE